MVSRQKSEGIKIKRHKTKLKNNIRNFKFSWKFFNRFLFTIILISGIYFVASINDLSVKGFLLNELKTEIMRINNENDSIELSIMASESYENLNSKAEELHMVKADKIDYITTVEDVMAKK